MYQKIGTEFWSMEAREDFIVIYNRDVKLLTHDQVQEISVFYRDITSIIIKEPRFLYSGYIEIKCPGNNFTSTDYNNPYAIRINGEKELEQARAFKKYVEEKIRSARTYR